MDSKSKEAYEIEKSGAVTASIKSLPPHQVAGCNTASKVTAPPVSMMGL